MTDHVERVSRFLDRWEQMARNGGGQDPEVIHGLDGLDNVLRVSDLRLLLEEGQHDKLHTLWDTQRRLQQQRFRDPARLNREEAIEFIRWNVLALTDELHEALLEVGWKPWASTRHINREEYVGELVDAFHFLINLCLVVGAEAEEIFERYLTKNEKNHRRQVEGYTGEKDNEGREID